MEFYAACLASYNNGALHGAWIKADTDMAAMQGAVVSMLGKSKWIGDASPLASEWAIHDSRGLGSIGEYAGLKEVARRAAISKVAAGRGIPASVLMEAMSEAGADDAEDYIESWFEGTAESWEAFAQEHTEAAHDMGAVPKWISDHIDWEAMGRTMNFNGEWRAFEDDGTLYFFRTR